METDILMIFDVSGMGGVASSAMRNDKGGTVLALALMAIPEGQIHHIASDKAIASGVTKEFEKIFAGAGMTLQDSANKIFVPGHLGRHSAKYNEYVLATLRAAVEGKSGAAYGNALRQSLRDLKQKILKNPGILKGDGI